MASNDILVVLEPDDSVRDALITLLRGRGWTIEIAQDVCSLDRLLENLDISAVISEASLPDCKALDVLNTCAERNVPVIFTGHDLAIQDAVDLIHHGAHDYLEKPFSQERLLDLLKPPTNRQNE